MGGTAEAVARRYDISRIEQDEFAVESQRRACNDAARAAYAEEITPVEVGGRHPMVVTEDEHLKPGTTLDALRGRQPSSRQGRRTRWERPVPSCAAAIQSLAQQLDHETRTISAMATTLDAQSRISAFAGRGCGIDTTDDTPPGPLGDGR